MLPCLLVRFLAKTKKTNTLAYCKFFIISLVRVRTKPHCHSPRASDGCTETALIVLTVLCARVSRSLTLQCADLAPDLIELPEGSTWSCGQGRSVQMPHLQATDGAESRHGFEPRAWGLILPLVFLAGR